MHRSERGGGKRIEVVEHHTFQQLPQEIELSIVEDYIKLLNVNEERNRRIVEKMGITSIHLTNHARRRWDTRVGPTNVSDNALTELLSRLCFQLGRIELLSKDCGVIDNDIVFFYEQENDRMNIITFYGRVSQRPALADVKQLKLFNYRELDEVKFELQKEELDAQLLPPVPFKRIVYRGRYSLYCLDAFDNQEKTIFHLSENSPKSKSDMYFSLDDEIHLNKSTITALRYLKY